MRIVIISDTHWKHEKLDDLYGDVLIHCGDMYYALGKNKQAISKLDEWFGRQQFQIILCTGGNHDFFLQDLAAQKKTMFKNAIYLQDQSYEYQGVQFYGSPWLPYLEGWAFYLDSESLSKKWSLIPEQVDVLITHTPPYGILDQNRSGKHCGCPELRHRVEQIRPKIHCFGHIHASAGVQMLNGTTFLNASSVNSKYQIARQPLVYTF